MFLKLKVPILDVEIKGSKLTISIQNFEISKLLPKVKCHRDKNATKGKTTKGKKTKVQKVRQTGKFILLRDRTLSNI